MPRTGVPTARAGMRSPRHRERCGERTDGADRGDQGSARVNILLWHVHGSWTTAFVQGRHRYLVPLTPTRDADGLGRARTWNWPASVVERTPAQLAHDDIDLVVLQRPRDEWLLHEWL